jgi:hypothetical protein
VIVAQLVRFASGAAMGAAVCFAYSLLCYVFHDYSFKEHLIFTAVGGLYVGVRTAMDRD